MVEDKHQLHPSLPAHHTSTLSHPRPPMHAAWQIAQHHSSVCSRCNGLDLGLCLHGLQQRAAHHTSHNHNNLRGGMGAIGAMVGRRTKGEEIWRVVGSVDRSVAIASSKQAMFTPQNISLLLIFSPFSKKEVRSQRYTYLQLPAHSPH